MIDDAIARNNYVFILTQQLLSAVKSLPIKLIRGFSAFVGITNLSVGCILNGHGVVGQ